MRSVTVLPSFMVLSAHAASGAFLIALSHSPERFFSQPSASIALGKQKKKQPKKVQDENNDTTRRSATTAPRPLLLRLLSFTEFFYEPTVGVKP